MVQMPPGFQIETQQKGVDMPEGFQLEASPSQQVALQQQPPQQTQAGPQTGQINESQFNQQQPKSQQDVLGIGDSDQFATPEQLASRRANLAALPETALTLGSGIVAEPLAGLAGIGAGLLPGPEGQAARAVEATRQAATFEPRSEAARSQVESLGETLKPVGEVIQKLETGLGDVAFEATGSPLIAAAATAIPTAIGELLGGAPAIRSAAGGLSRAAQIIKAAPDAHIASILKAAKKNNVPVLTSDLFPPNSFVGRTAQAMSEKLGPLGSGSARVSQQSKRVEAVSGLVDELGIDIDSPFVGGMVKSINTKAAKTLENAGKVRGEAVSALDKFGGFETPRAIEAIDILIAKEKRLGTAANQSIIKELESFRQPLSEISDFSLKKDLRTQVIKRKNALARGEDLAPVAAIQSLKSALDKDMISFARGKDTVATRKWLSSNRKFAEELDIQKNTELKRILNSGEATPEMVIPILKSGKPSQLKRLNGSMGEKGRANTRKALIQQALTDAKFFETDVNPNPDALINALNRKSFQQAKKVFFTGKAAEELDGFVRMLDVTRRAQSGQAVVKTGEQLLLPAAAATIGFTAAANPFLTVSAVATTTALAKAYESVAFRTIMTKLKSSPKGSKSELSLLQKATPLILSELQAAKELSAER